MRFGDPAAFERTLNVNLLVAWRTLHAALPHLVARRGYALTIASIAAVAHVPALAAYSASKAGLEALSDALRLEVAHLGVDVGVAYFSWIDTAMVRGRSTGSATRIARLARPPLHRVHPVADAGSAIVDAVEHRRRAVFHPRWLRAAMPARGLVQPLLDRALAAAAAGMDAAAAERAGDGRDLAPGPGSHRQGAAPRPQ